jgi:small ligand-binding sensory domain FIST
MKAACSVAVNPFRVAWWAALADSSIFANNFDPAAVNLQILARLSSPLTGRSTKFLEASRFRAPVVVVRSSAISAAKVV